MPRVADVESDERTTPLPGKNTFTDANSHARVTNVVSARAAGVRDPQAFAVQ
jgi:hypothetical protein